MILARRTTMPWKNGGGVTHELWRTPKAGPEFDLRISIAEVAANGPFSLFPGVDRIITLLSGGGFRLAGGTIDQVVSAPGATSTVTPATSSSTVNSSRGSGMRPHAP